MGRLLSRGLPVAMLACAAFACNSTSTNVPTSPTTTVTESFSGTLNPNGGDTHAFTVTGKGTVRATLTAVGADNTLVVGLALGNWTGASCNLSAANDNAVATVPLVATVSAAGLLCARVYDTKGLAEPTSYTVEVVHP